MDRKRADLDNLKAELGWSMVTMVQSEVQKIQDSIDQTNSKIELYQQKLNDDAERKKQMIQEKVNHEFQKQNLTNHLYLSWELSD